MLYNNIIRNIILKDYSNFSKLLVFTTVGVIIPHHHLYVKRQILGDKAYIIL